MEQPEALPELERQMERSSLFMQASFDQISARTSGVEGFVMGLVEALRAKGVIQDGDLGIPSPAESTPDGASGSSATELDPSQEAPGEVPSAPPPVSWPSIALRVEGEELNPPAEVNCAERIHICHAVCCKLNFALTAEEIDAGKVKWDLGFPYIVRHAADGFCTHNDRATGGCRVYADRPGVCRRYSCAGDRRIWKDFDNMVLNSEWLDEHLSEPTRIRLRVDLPLMQATEARAGGVEE